jgi:hypothetical protein
VTADRPVPVVVVVDGRPVWQAAGEGERIVVRLESGADGPASWRWRTRDGGARRLPGCDALDADWSVVPALPGVGLRFCSTDLGHPLGELTVAYELVDGRPASVAIGGRELRSDVDVWFEYPAVRRLEQWAGLRSAVEMLAPPADLGGDLDAAMLVAGLVDDAWAGAYGLGAADLRDALHLYRALDGASLLSCIR